MNRKRTAIGAVLIASCLGMAIGTNPGVSVASEAPDTTGLHMSAALAHATGQRTVRPGSAEAQKAPLSSVDMQLLASEFFARLQESNPSTFVSYGRTAQGVNEYFVNFTTEPSAEVLSSLTALPFYTVVNWGFPASGQQLEVAADELTRALDEDPRVAELRVGGVATPAGQGIDVRIVPTDSTAAAAEDIVAEAVSATDAARSSRPLLDIPVVSTGGPVGFEAQADVKGGHATNCYTTGFTASWNGNLGFMTASHGTSCASLNLYDSASGVISSFNMPRRPAVNGGYVDVWFAKTQAGHATTYRFRDSASTDIVATGVAGPSVNMDVCKYGLVTGRHCGASTPLYVISSQSFCATNSQGSGADGLTYCRLWEANRDVTDHGDSGGPWFLGQAAVGITAGTGGANSIFTAATSIEVQGIIVRQQ